MSIREAVIVALPILLVPSLAIADEPKSQGDAKQQSPQPQQSQPKKPQKTQQEDPNVDTSKAGANDKHRQVLGKDVVNKDDDLDVAVGNAQTTSAEPQPAQRDVIESRAEERREREGRRINIAPLLGYGTNDFNLGVGARAGYTFATPVYVGGTFMYYAGSDSSTIGAQSQRIETVNSFFYPGAEVGYDIGIGPVMVRPYGGAGALFARNRTSINGTAATDTGGTLVVYPGVTAQYIFRNSPVFVGGDTRVLIPLEEQGASFQLFATAGLSL